MAVLVTKFALLFLCNWNDYGLVNLLKLNKMDLANFKISDGTIFFDYLHVSFQLLDIYLSNAVYVYSTQLYIEAAASQQWQ